MTSQVDWLNLTCQKWGNEQLVKFKDFDNSKKVLVTGGAGFIGFYLSKRLLDLGANVVGFDNCNDCYGVSLKEC